MTRSALILSLLLPSTALCFEIQRKNQGFSLQIEVSNLGTFESYDEPYLTYAPWIGGIVDTSESGTFPPVKLVTTGHEGWAGPLFEFTPGTETADTIWEANLNNPVEPPGWMDYWGPTFPFQPFSDQDFYCRYRDNAASIPSHVPLDLDIIQSSFAWDDTFAEGIIIVEYRITTVQEIDAGWMGFYFEGSGPSRAGFSSGAFLSYFLPENPPETATGIAILHSSVPLDPLSATYAWYPGSASPPTDEARYDFMSSGSIMPEQDPPGFARSLLSIGPVPEAAWEDTLVTAVAILSGADLVDLQDKALRARAIYYNSISNHIDDDYPQPPYFRLLQNFPNPFNPETEIGFQLEDSGPVTLRVYDALGREVATLIDEPLAVGSYRVRFNSAEVASGVYFYRLTAGKNMETRRMIVVK